MPPMSSRVVGDQLEAAFRRLPRWLGIALVIYALVTLFLALHHEAWCDEADTWLLMRDGGAHVMLSRTGYAGTPALWYLVLAPLASIGLPYVAQQLVSLLLVWSAMALFVADAPFRSPVKLLFLFSYYAVIEYAVQARPYSLLIALLFAIASSWRHRDEHPLRIAVLTALLANTTVHGLLIAAVVGVLLLGEAVRRVDLVDGRKTVALLIMLAGGVASVIQLWPPPDVQQLRHYIAPDTVPYAIGYAFLPGVDPRWSFAAGLVVLLLAVLSIGNRTLPLLFVTFSIAALLVLFVYVWLAGSRHTGLILMVVLAGVWMAGPEDVGAEQWRRSARRFFEASLALIFVWGLYAAAQDAIAETRWAYSGSQEMAQYVAGHVPPGTIIAAHVPIYCESILAYLPGRSFWYPAEHRAGSFMTWDRAFQRAQAVRTETAVEMARRQLAGKRWVLLVNQELSAAQQHGFRLLYTNRRRVYGRPLERYWLYAPEGHFSAE